MTRRGGGQQIPRPPVWERFDTPPWPDGTRFTFDTLLDAVPAESAPPLPAFPDARLSAVLVVLVADADDVHVLLTRRSMHMRNHRGEISFPGGRVDDGESAVEAAVREAHEEVGLDPGSLRIVGELEHLNTIVSRSYIVPVVATVERRPELAPETPEVDRVLWTPVGALTAPGTYRMERWGTPPMDRPLHFFELDDETVWGATAHMLVDLLTRAAAGSTGSSPGAIDR